MVRVHRPQPGSNINDNFLKTFPQTRERARSPARPRSGYDHLEHAAYLFRPMLGLRAACASSARRKACLSARLPSPAHAGCQLTAVTLDVARKRIEQVG
jgi:hypothetical protein